MADIRIIKKDLADYFNAIEEINRDFFNHIKLIYESLPREKQYVYYMTLPYGKKLIRNARFVVLDKTDQSNDIDLQCQFNNEDISLNQVKNDFGKNIDFPLSVVLKNKVEVFMERKLDESLIHKIPLDIISEGELFGVWGVFDQITGQKKVSVTQEWQATSGRSCFVPFFKNYPSQESRGKSRDRIFEWLFFEDEKEAQELSADKAIQEFIKKHIPNSHVEILCLPKHYYINEVLQNDKINFYKNSFLLNMFQKQWHDTNTERETFWKNVQLKLELEIKLNLNSFDIQVINHIINIIKGRDFYLKPLSEKDNIEYTAYKLMVEKIKELKFNQKGGCSKLNTTRETVTIRDKEKKPVENGFQVYTPYFMYYDKGKKSQSKILMSFLKSPLIMTLFYYDGDLVKKKRDWSSKKLSSIERVIKSYTGEEVELKILRSIPESIEFINKNIGKKPKEFSMHKPFDYVEIMSKNELHRQFFSQSKKNCPDLLKQYLISIEIKK